VDPAAGASPSRRPLDETGDETTGTRRVAFVDSGLGLVGYADALRALRPDLSLVLAMDPDHMPYGPRRPDEVSELILHSARSTLAYGPDAVVVACNTASIHGLEALRAELEPDIPVIGTVPAIRPAAADGDPVAVWATAATAASDYLRGLVDAFAADVETHVVAAHGLAEAIESADPGDVERAIADAVSLTPGGIRNLVLGCTHYGLVADRIAAVVGPDITIFDSPVAVARQTLRRIGLEPDPTGTPSDIEAVLLSGRPGSLPGSLRAYPAGERLLGSDAGSARGAERPGRTAGV
jgi:glutamate racemase